MMAERRGTSPRANDDNNNSIPLTFNDGTAKVERTAPVTGDQSLHKDTTIQDTFPCHRVTCEHRPIMVAEHPRPSPRRVLIALGQTAPFLLSMNSRIRRIHVAIVAVVFLISGAVYFGRDTSLSPPSAEPYGPTVLETGLKDYDWAHNLALAEMEQNVQGNHFVAGEGWSQLWTRDTSYAAEQAASLLFPEVVRSSLEESVENDPDGAGTVWLQDSCAHFGGWPNLSDAIVGARGAWSVYRAEGNRTFLEWAYVVTKNSLARAERDAFDDEITGLFTGCSSFMESNSGYPAKYHHRGDLVGKTKALSTNSLHYSGYEIAALMGRELGEEKKEIKHYEDKASRLRSAIREHLWIPGMYYSYFMDENGKLMKNYEGLGESLMLLDGIETDPRRIATIFSNVNQTKYGLPSLWPQFDLDPKSMKHISLYYHDGRLWPFVQGYFAMAAAKHRKVDIFAHSLQALKDLVVKSNTFAEFYELNGTFPLERSRQLWSETGYLAMIYQGLFGISYDVDGLRISPVKPESIFPDDIILKNFKYRDMILNITVKGSGYQVASLKIDGKKQRGGSTPKLPRELKGRHVVDIELKI